MSIVLDVLICVCVLFAQIRAEPIILQKCCDFGQIYRNDNGSCVPLESSDNTTEWRTRLPGLSNFNSTVDWKEGGPKPHKCDPGFNYRELVFSSKPILLWVLNGTDNVAYVGDHPDYLFVKLDQICFDGVQDGGGKLLLARMCFRSPCQDHVCVRKCCPTMTAIFNTDKGPKCKFTPEADRVKIKRHRIYSFSAEELDEQEQKNAYTVPGYPPNCQDGRLPNHLDPGKNPDDAFYVDTNGSLYVPRLRKTFSRSQYCVEKVDNRTFPVAILCYAESNKSDANERRNTALIVYASCAILSQVCLLLTFVVYWLLPNLMNLNGKNLMSYVGSLFWAYFHLTALHLAGVAILEASRGLCRIMGLLEHYFFMTAFFWLSVMSFDLWRTFRSMKVQSGRDASSSERRRFLLYSIYAWGSPLMISIITITMELTPGISPFYIKPRFAHSGCWFSNKESIFLYFLGPMAVVLLANLVFFIMTTVKLVQITRQTKVLDDMQDNKQQKRNRFVLYMKLLIVMGVPWILEVIAWVSAGPQYIWYATNVSNCLQGVFIFAIFIVKRPVLRMLNSKYKLIQNKRVLEVLQLQSLTSQAPSQGSNVTNVTTTSM